MSSSKGVIQQSFTFILFVLVIGFLGLLAYQAITSIMSGQCEAQQLSFQQDLFQYIDQYDDYGAVHNEQISMPCSYRAICMVNQSEVNSGDDEFDDTYPTLLLEQPEYQPVIETALETQQNVFLIGEFAEPIGFANKTVLNNDVTCFNATAGSLNLRFRGQGRTTLIEPQ